ncbi:hypothetical protein KIH27_08960 [Mycobacterium sp. M1]|uniref:ESX-1 scaffolding and assembly protein SaeB n=1 Tax=Mycolicibacter acidiphilus TaxID=2835306 RepID=A0ABS5RHP5_9MYCO|nr:hypothetical protein [Mycolicibacter acidiphilus]MBS9533714.1 hypothetical protein [Mycolicibacter acidiphilus]
MSTRYGQLSYTSFDGAGTAGGWQIKQSVGDLSEAETELLVSGVRTVFRPAEPLPEYPSGEQLDAAPRRLAYGRSPDGAGAYWHSVAAGADSTGRPGNVFAHTVLDRTPDAGPVLRPIELWRSPEWLRPYGAAAVAAATLPVGPPAVGRCVTKDSVVAFALDTVTWRLPTLLGLLDAVAAALDGGAPVVLGAESADSAAQWIGLVSFLMSAGTAAALSFSTFDRADQLPAALHSGQHLTAVPLIDAEALPAGTVFIDETALLSLGELGGQPHCTSTGQQIEVTTWSVLAQEVLLDQDEAREILDSIDRFAAATPDRGLHPAWPLAMAVASNGAFADAHPEARQVITAHSPAGVTVDSAAAQVIRETLAELVGDTTADAWKAVEQNLTGYAADYATRTYLCRAVADDGWLGQPGPVPMGGRSYRGRPVPEDVSAALGPALERARTDGDGPLITLADLLVRAGIEDGRVGAVLDGFAHRLADPQAGPTLIETLGDRVGPQARIAAAAPTVRAALQNDGTTTLSTPVVDWLTGGLTMPTPDELQSAERFDEIWMRAAVCGLRADRHGSTGEADRFARLWWLAACNSPRRAEIAAGRVWAPEQLLAIGVAGCDSAMLLSTLLGTVDGDPLLRLCDAVLTANADDYTVSCAMLRRFDAAAWVQRDYIDVYLRAYLPLWDSVLAQIPADQVHRDFAVRLVTVAAVAGALGLPRPHSAEVLAADEAVAGVVAQEIMALVEHRVISAVAVVAASLVPAASGEAGTDGSPRGIDAVLAAAGEVSIAVGHVTENDEETVAEMLAKTIGDGTEGSASRRYRKLVHNLFARRGDVRPPASSWMHGSH